MKKNFTEQQTIKACLRGDRKAQYKLYEQYKVYLFGICMRYGDSRAEAEDMLQEGFYQILKDLKQFSGKVPLRAWMRRVMINSALMHIRKHHKLTYTAFEQEWNEHPLLMDESLLQKDRANAIIYWIRQLPILQQTVFNLRAIDEYSFKEIAEFMGGNEATMRSHYLRGRTKLQSMLKKELNKDG